MATANFQATCSADGIKAHWYIEIEGIRCRYGDNAPSWNPADSGTNRPIKEYFTELPRITGQAAEPLNGTTTPHKFSVSILDVDEEITTLFSVADNSGGKSFLNEQVDVGETAVDVIDGSQITIGDDVYFDRETCRVTNVVGNTLTLTRGMYGSEEVAHLLTDDQGNARTVAVYTSPPFMYTREVTLCEGRTSLLEADVIKFRGYLDGADEGDGVWNIQCSGFLRRLNCMICESLAQTTLAMPLWDETLSVWESESTDPSEVTTSWIIAVEDSANFRSGGGYCIIDEEIIHYEGTEAGVAAVCGFDVLQLNTDTTFNEMNIVASAANRGLFAVEILGSVGMLTRKTNTGSADGSFFVYQVSRWCAAHYAGAPVREIFHSQQIKDELTLTDTAPLKASDVILTMLTSTGAGTNGAYDVLPKGWGAGILAAKVDVTGIENICKHPSIAGINFHPFCITKATDCKEWLEENILRPCHLFFVEDDGGKISVRRLYSKNEAVELTTPTALTENNLLSIPRFAPGKAPLGGFSWKMNWHPGKDEFLGTINVVLADGRTRYMSTARKFDLEIKTVYDSRIGIGRGQWISGDTGDLPSAIGPYIDVVFTNFALVPCPMVEFPVALNQFVNVQVGQVITLTSTQTPDIKNSDRGITAEYFQVVEATPNPATSSVDLVCWMIGVNNADTRLLAPAAKVKSWDAVNHRATLYDDIFTDGVMYTYDIDAFIATDDVMFVDAAYDGLGGGAPEHGAITAIHDSTGSDDGYVQFAGEPTDVPGDGDYVVTGNYENSTATQKAKWAYLADTTPALGTAEDSAHKYER